MRIPARIVGVAATTALVLGGAAVTAPTASAVMVKGCKAEWKRPFKQDIGTAVHLRSGPGTKYTSKGILYKGVTFAEYCHNYTWAYGKVNSGPNKGKKGWVNIGYYA